MRTVVLPDFDCDGGPKCLAINGHTIFVVCSRSVIRVDHEAETVVGVCSEGPWGRGVNLAYGTPLPWGQSGLVVVGGFPGSPWTALVRATHPHPNIYFGSVMVPHPTAPTGLVGVHGTRFDQSRPVTFFLEDASEEVFFAHSSRPRLVQQRRAASSTLAGVVPNPGQSGYLFDVRDNGHESAINGRYYRVFVSAEMNSLAVENRPYRFPHRVPYGRVVVDRSALVGILYNRLVTIPPSGPPHSTRYRPTTRLAVSPTEPLVAFGWDYSLYLVRLNGSEVTSERAMVVGDTVKDVAFAPDGLTVTALTQTGRLVTVDLE